MCQTDWVKYPSGACDLESKLANDALGLPREEADAATKAAIEMAANGEF
jgi:hypothetical protein